MKTKNRERGKIGWSQRKRRIREEKKWVRGWENVACLPYSWQLPAAAQALSVFPSGGGSWQVAAPSGMSTLVSSLHLSDTLKIQLSPWSLHQCVLKKLIFSEHITWESDQLLFFTISRYWLQSQVAVTRAFSFELVWGHVGEHFRPTHLLCSGEHQWHANVCNERLLTVFLKIWRCNLSGRLPASNDLLQCTQLIWDLWVVRLVNSN